MPRRRELNMSATGELVCELIASGISAALLHFIWDLPWWPDAILWGLLLGFGTWIILVDIDWTSRGGERSKDSSCDGGGSSGWLDFFH